MPGHPLTPSQRAAVLAADRHVLVEAGAGTGKTTTVVARILYMLGVPVDGATCPAPISLDRVAAITFTTSAAAELRRKLRAGLRDAGRRELAWEVDGARIGTIHSFCGDLLREFALRSGQPPVARVMEEGEGMALVGETIRETMLEALENRLMPGLDNLLAEYRAGDVEVMAANLVADGALLDRLGASTQPGANEAALVALAALARERLARHLRRTGTVDFDRMITWTRDLLRDHPGVLSAVQRNLRLLIVDEFQDVDPVQREIADLIGDPASGRPETPRLMLVGDPKQSIYRFRRADVTTWRSVADAFAGHGHGTLVLPLEENFRSVPAILGLVDAAIGPVLDTPIEGDELARYEVSYRSVAAQREPGGEPAVEAIVVNTDGAKPKVDEVRRAEAARVAGRATELIAGGTPARDIAILLASWSDAELYEEALRAVDIPTYLLRTDGFHERREVQDLVLALEAMRDPGDDLALTGFLRSPFVGLRDETLLALAWGSGATLWEKLQTPPPGAPEPELCGAAVHLIAEHAALRDRLPTDELLERLIERSGYLAHLVLQGDDAQQAIANLRKFVGQARNARHQPVGEFLREIREVVARGDRVPDARLHGERDDVVTISSIHSAKGLEWKVVFWCDLARAAGGRGNHAKWLVDGDQIVLKLPGIEAKAQPPRWQEAVAVESRESLAESKRLWYVAATRARDRLVLSGFTEAGGKDNSPAAALWGQLGELPVVEGASFDFEGQGGRKFMGTVRVAGLLPAAPEAGETDGGWDAPLPESLPLAPEPITSRQGHQRHSATALMTHARCGRRHWLRYVAGLQEPKVPREGADYMTALTRGQILHDALEHVGESDRLDAVLEAAIGRWDPEAPAAETEAGDEYRELLRGELARVAGDPAYRALADHPTARHELPFVRLLDESTWLEGKIDLAAAPGPGAVLLDVKTWRGEAEGARRHAEHYSLQRDVYAEAVEALGQPVDRFVLQYSHAGVQVVLPWDRAEREAARERIAGALRRIGDGEAAMTDHAMECRWCGYRAAGWCEGVE